MIKRVLKGYQKGIGKVKEQEQDKEQDKDKEQEQVIYAENVKMNKGEYNTLVTHHGKFYTEKSIAALDNYKGSSGKKYKNDYRTILSWVMEKVKKEFPVSKHQDGKKDEKFNRSGIDKIAKITKEIG